MDSTRFLMHCLRSVYVRRLLVPLVLFVVGGAAQCAAEQQRPIRWDIVQGRHCLIYYQSKKDIVIFNAKLYMPVSLMKAFEMSSELDDKTPRKEVARKVDFIYERVQALLDMRKRMPRVLLYVYKNHVQIEFEFSALYGKKGRIPRSWYVYEMKSVFVNLQDITTNILAHEIAHHVIDHFYSARPDAASGELLAVFVEKNFDK